MDPTAIPIYTYNIKDDHPFNDLYNKLEKQVEEDFKYIYYDYHRKQFYFISNEKDEKKKIPIPEGDIFDFVYSNEIDEKKGIPIPEYLNLLISEEEVPALAPALAAPAAPFVPATPAPTPSGSSGTAPAPSGSSGTGTGTGTAHAHVAHTPVAPAPAPVAPAASNTKNTFIDTIFKNYDVYPKNNGNSTWFSYYRYYYPPNFRGLVLKEHNANEPDTYVDKIIDMVAISWEYYFVSNFKNILNHIQETNDDDLKLSDIEPLLIYLYIEDIFNTIKNKKIKNKLFPQNPPTLNEAYFTINFTKDDDDKTREVRDCKYYNSAILSEVHTNYKFVNYFGYPLIRVYIYWIKYYKAIPLNTKKKSLKSFFFGTKKIINLVNKLADFIKKVNVLNNNDVEKIIPHIGFIPHIGNVLPENITDNNNKIISDKVKKYIKKNFNDDNYEISFKDKINNYINNYINGLDLSFITSGGAMSRGGNGGYITPYGNWHDHNIQKINILETSNDPNPQVYYLFPHDPNNYYVFPSGIIPRAPIISQEDQPRVLESNTDWQEYVNRISDGGTTSIVTNLQHFNANDGKDRDKKKIRKAWDVVKEDGIITYKRHNGYFEMTRNRTSDENIYSTKLEIKFFKFINNDIIKLLKYDKEPIIEKDSNDVTKENINLIDIDDTDITIIILNNLDNEQGLSLIYDVKFKDIFFSDNKKLINKIFAKIYNHSQDKVDNDIYIFFNVKIENIMKIQSNIIITNKNHKKNFKSLNEKLKNIISYYKTINQLIYFDKYMKLELHLLYIIKLYILIPIPKKDIPANVPQNSNEEYSIKILDLFKNELAIRHSICDDITLINKNKNIDKYKKILHYTYNNIETYYNNLTEDQKKTYITDIAKNSIELKKKIRYYGKTFIY